MTHSRSWDIEIERPSVKMSSCDIFSLGFVVFPCPTHYRASSVKCLLTTMHHMYSVQDRGARTSVACWSGSRVPRRRLSPSVGRWSSPTAVTFQWHAKSACAANTQQTRWQKFPRLWNDFPPRLRQPGLTFDSFRQSLKTHLFGDQSD